MKKQTASIQSLIVRTWRSCSCKSSCVLVLLYLRYVCGNSFSITRLIECNKKKIHRTQTSVKIVFSFEDSRMKLLSSVRNCSTPAAPSLYWQHPAVQDPVRHKYAHHRQTATLHCVFLFAYWQVIAMSAIADCIIVLTMRQSNTRMKQHC